MAAVAVALPGLDPLAVLQWPWALLVAVEDQLRRQAERIRAAQRR